MLCFASGYNVFLEVHIFLDIPATYTVVPGSQEKRFFIVKDLLPNNGYTFRVTAKNDKGVGTPSIPRGNYPKYLNIRTLKPIELSLRLKNTPNKSR